MGQVSSTPGSSRSSTADSSGRESGWAFGGTAGRATGNGKAGDYSPNMNDAATALLAIAAAVGILMMVRRRGRGHLWLPVALTWVGVGAMFA